MGLPDPLQIPLRVFGTKPPSRTGSVREELFGSWYASDDVRTHWTCQVHEPVVNDLSRLVWSGGMVKLRFESITSQRWVKGREGSSRRYSDH